MGDARNPFVRLDRQKVIGALRATGSRDPDVLRARKRGLIRTLRVQQVVGGALALAGLFLCLAWIGPRFGVPIAVVGAWLWLRGARSVAAVKTAYVEFVKRSSL